MGRQDDLDNHANQLNPNNDAYWESRGFDGPPGNWDADDWDGDDWYDDDSEFQSGDTLQEPAGKKLRALLLVGGVASAGVAASLLLPLTKRLKDRLGRQMRSAG